MLYLIVYNDTGLVKILLHPGCTLPTLLGLLSDYLSRFVVDAMFIKVVDQLWNPNTTINMYVHIQVSGFRETSLGTMQTNFISVDLRMYAYAHLTV